MNDLVKAVDHTWDSGDAAFTTGYGSMQIRVCNITDYYDVESKEHEGQDFIEFQMKIVNEKLDEIEKDVNTESGVEDSEPEEKWTFVSSSKFVVNTFQLCIQTLIASKGKQIHFMNFIDVRPYYRIVIRVFQ